MAGESELASLDSLDHVIHLGHCHEPDFELMCPWVRSSMGQLARLADGGIDENDLRLALLLAFKLDTNDLRSNCAGEQPGFRPEDLERLRTTALTMIGVHAAEFRPHLETWCNSTPPNTRDTYSAAAVRERKCFARAALERLGEIGRDCGCPTPVDASF